MLSIFLITVSYILQFGRQRLDVVSHRRVMKTFDLWKKYDYYKYSMIRDKYTYVNSTSIIWLALLEPVKNDIVCLCLMENIGDDIVFWNMYAHPQKMSYGSELIKAFANQDCDHIHFHSNFDSRWKLEYQLHKSG